MVQRDNDIVFETVKSYLNNTVGLERLLVNIGFRKPHDLDCQIDGCGKVDNRSEVLPKCSTPNVAGIYSKKYGSNVVYAVSAYGGEYGREFTVFGKRSFVLQAIKELRQKDKDIYKVEQSNEKMQKERLNAVLRAAHTP
ncbi:MAG: hypothetical protein HY438_02290 [DPANN group archaeon]|nr:hypothetical protein [DPANN group archaeon]